MNHPPMQLNWLEWADVWGENRTRVLFDRETGALQWENEVGDATFSALQQNPRYLEVPLRCRRGSPPEQQLLELWVLSLPAHLKTDADTSSADHFFDTVQDAAPFKALWHEFEKGVLRLLTENWLSGLGVTVEWV